MKGNEEIMEILEAFDLTQSNEAAARLGGCDPKTVARLVSPRDSGNEPVGGVVRNRAVDNYLAKIEEWVDRSNADIRADVVHRKLQADGLRRLRAHHPACGCRGHKADIVPTTGNLRDTYESFGGLETACRDAMNRFNTRDHRETRRQPSDMIAGERLLLHPVPALAHIFAFGSDRTVDDDSTIRFGSARYSRPHILIGEKVWARVSGDELMTVDASPSGAREVARYKLTTPGNPRIEDAHYPQRSGDPLHPRPRPRGAHERASLAIGDGAEQWLIEAAATGVERVRTKMTEATELAALVGVDVIDGAPGDGSRGGSLGHW